jgi:hypothetical protein
MKKYIFGFLIAVSLTACSNSVESETEGEGDTTTIKCVDTTHCVTDSIKIK